MRKLLFQILLASAVWLSFAGVSVAKDHDHGDSDRGHHADRDHDGDRDHDRDWRDDRDRDDRGNPPGWGHGRKTGWGNCDMPPGLAKKNGGCDNDRDRDDRPVAHSRHHHHTVTSAHTTSRPASHPPVHRAPITSTASNHGLHIPTGSKVPAGGINPKSNATGIVR